MNIGGLVAGIVLSALVLLVMHWFPWPDGLSRLGAYALGVIALLLGFSLWRLLLGDWQTPAGLAIISASGGIVVAAAYKLDHYVVRIRKGDKAEATDDELA